MFMKQSRSLQIWLAAGYILCGIAIGLFSYQAFFLLPGESRNGMATFFASICSLLGGLTLTVSLAEARRRSSDDEKHDA
jgi:hypothetical protein